jgi:hypothetical protein
MSTRSRVRPMMRLLATGAGFAAGAYAAYAGITWIRYGRTAPADPAERDELLDAFMPTYDVVERHHIRVSAPSAVTWAAAKDQDLLQSPVARAIFRTREIVLGSTRDTRSRPRGLMAVVQSLGWRVLAEVPDREIVVGAVTKPWEADVTFRGLPPEEFAAFQEPGFVKIAWTLRADPVGESSSVFRTETRAIATDATARAKFRQYWSFVSPGVSTIRWLSLRPLKHEAERRFRSTARLVVPARGH